MKQKEKRNKTIDNRQRSDTKGQADNYRKHRGRTGQADSCRHVYMNNSCEKLVSCRKPSFALIRAREVNVHKTMLRPTAAKMLMAQPSLAAQRANVTTTKTR
jgi:hypothetical protein